MNTPDSEVRPAKSSRPDNKLLIAAVVVAVIILGLFLWGQFQTRSQLSAQQVEYEQRIGATQDQLEEARQDLVAALNRNQLLMARTDLYRTAADLDQRNFGTANERLQEAAAALAKVDATSGDVDAQQLSALRSSISAMNINVATDLQQQRNQVLDLAAQLDALVLGAETPTAP